MRSGDTDAARLRRAIANARLLADELARRDTGGTWTQQVTIRTEFAAEPTTAATDPAADLVTDPATDLVTDPATEPATEPAADPVTEPATDRDAHSTVDSSAGASVATAPMAQPRRRVAVVCWDLGHNPAGRAMMLADLHLEAMEVDLIGPLWSRYADKLWSPIETGGYSTVTFTCDRMVDFVPKAYAVAARRRYDLVHVCKPRLPGLALGSMIARASRCPMIVDIDDDELAFFADVPEVDLDAVDPVLLQKPIDAYGTVIGTSLARHSSVRTVSNVVLRAEYGGIVVRHARSAKTFDPARVSRADGRARLGAAPEDFVVLFVGTPRPHKGLDIVTDAMRLLDSRFVLHVVGVSEPDEFRAEIDTTDIRVVTHPPTEIGILPELIAAGDAIALMQHLDDPISASQIPAKISDGLSMGCPVIVTDAPPLRDLQDHGLLRADDAIQLAEHLEVLATGESEFERRKRRDAFLGEFSVEVNAARVELADREARELADDGPNPVIAEALNATRAAYMRLRRTERHDLYGDEDPAPDHGSDIVVFWKQNDTGIYGRRCEMITKYLAEDPRVRRILHLDAPVDADYAARQATLVMPHDDETPLIGQVLLDRRIDVVRSGKVHHRTYLFSKTGTRDPLSGKPLGRDEDGFGDFVLDQMTELGMNPSSAIAWVCPIAPGFLDVYEQLKFKTLVADVIDDQRSFNHPRRTAEDYDAMYRQVLGAADVAFTNCEPNITAFSSYTRELVLVPNGTEPSAFSPIRATINIRDDRPVIAYVGNMRDRIDWALLDDVVGLRPNYRFVLAGSAPESSGAHALAERHDNVELVGIVPYPQLRNFLAKADVALVPHLGGSMTERMNPLKVYNYVAAGVPVVSTSIPNGDELLDFITFADDASSFAKAIDEGIQRRRAGPIEAPPERLAAVDWSTRARTMLDHLERRGLIEAAPSPDAVVSGEPGRIEQRQGSTERAERSS